MTVNQIKMIKQPAPDELKNDNKTVVHLKFYTNNNNKSNKLHVISRKHEQKHPDGMYILETNYWYGTWHEHDYQYKTHTVLGRWQKKMYTSKKAAITYFKKPQNTI